MSRSLRDLKPGQVAQVVDIASNNTDQLLKLSALGLVPGCFVRLQQRFPVYIVRVGETLLSLDGAIAEKILLSQEIEPVK